MVYILSMEDKEEILLRALERQKKKNSFAIKQEFMLGYELGIRTSIAIFMDRELKEIP